MIVNTNKLTTICFLCFCTKPCFYSKTKNKASKFTAHEGVWPKHNFHQQ